MDSYRKPEEQASQDPNNNNSNKKETTLYDLPLEILYMIIDDLDCKDLFNFCVAYTSSVYGEFLNEKKYRDKKEILTSHKIKEFTEWSNNRYKLFEKYNQKKFLQNTQLTCGYYSTFLLKPGAEPMVWGGNFYFRRFYKTFESADVKSLVECNNRAFVILQDNSVYAFGENYFGELGLPISGWVAPTQILKNREIIKISMGCKHTLFLSKNGEVFSSGDNFNKQLGFPFTYWKSTPGLIEIDETIIDIATGHYHSLLVTQKGEVLGCGLNDMGQLGMGDGIMEKDFKKIGVPGFVIQVAAGNSNSLFLNSKGEVYFCGNNRFEPFQIEFFKNTKIVSIIARENSAFFLTEDGQVYQLVNKLDSQFNLIGELTLMDLPGKIYSISAGFSHLAFLSRNGNIYTTGSNQYGQLGYDTDDQIQELQPEVDLQTKIQTTDTAQENTESENNNNNNNKRQRLL